MYVCQCINVLDNWLPTVQDGNMMIDGEYPPRCNHGVAVTKECRLCEAEAYPGASMPDPIQLVPNRSDQDIVDDLRKRVIEAYRPLLDLCTEAHKSGLAMQIEIGPDAFGVFGIRNFQVIKIFK